MPLRRLVVDALWTSPEVDHRPGRLERVSPSPGRVAAAVAQLGGITTRRELLRLVDARDLRPALARGEVRRAGRGRYALPTDIAARAAAEEVHGTAILLSAAAHWRWRRKWDPKRPQIAVRRGRRVSAELRERFDVRWRSIPESDLDA